MEKQTNLQKKQNGIKRELGQGHSCHWLSEDATSELLVVYFVFYILSCYRVIVRSKRDFVS